MTDDETLFRAPRLTRLEIQGFKSFLNRTTFAFEPGITAIVGPNGSGKSNVADAVRWVLGEQGQSALRARKTEDVIFSGGQGRAPAGLAEATLTFDNSDGWLPSEFSEVSVTRRAYRSGENQYLINGRRVRLKDVALLTAGLGQSHVVVGQGLVDAALSLRAEERRGLFEHAADLTGLRLKVVEAERNLAETDANTTRLRDLMIELEPRLRNLERAARQALEWQGLRERLRDLQSAHYRAGLESAQETLAAAHLAAQTAERTAEQARVDEIRLAEEHQQASDALSNARQRLDEHDRRWAEVGELVRRQTHERDLAAARVESLSRRRADMNDTRQGLDERVASVAAELAKLTIDLRELERATTDSRGASARFARELAAQRQERAALETQLAQASSALRAGEQTRADLTRQHAVLAERATALSTELDRLHVAIAERQQRRESLAGDVAQAITAVSEDEERGAAVDARLRALHEQLDKATNEAATTHGEADRAQRALAEATTRLDVLRRLQESGAGLHGGVKTVITSARRGALSGIVGTVAELVHAPRELEVAIEVALGGRLHDVVVARWTDAEAAIAHLKTANAGRATFQPLDTVRGGRSAPLAAARSLPGYLGNAADLVAASHEVAPVVDALLGRIIVVEALADARAALEHLSSGWSVVTRGGEIARAGGSLTGGSAARESGTLSRERELRELPATIAVLETTVAAARERAASADAAMTLILDEQRRLEGERAALRAAADERKQQRARLEGWIGEIGDELARSERRRDELYADQRRVASELEEVDHELTTLATTRDESAHRQHAAHESLATLSAAMANSERAAADEGRRLAGLEERLRGERRREAGLLAQERALADELALRDERTAMLERERAALTAEHERLVAAADASARELAKLTAGRKPLLREASEAERALGVLAQALQRARLQVVELDRERDHAGFNLERATQEWATLRQRIVEDLDLTAAEEILSWPPADVDTPEAQRELEIGRLRERLRRVGYVGDDAVAEYERERTQQAYLQEQLADVEAAASSLRDLLAGLRQTMRDRFAETFTRVAEAFAQAFTTLFGGGTAKLELAAGDESHEPGIEIIAQPPGKRLQNLALLSGGERALTAAALLFAILKVNPVPFCLLDEVDAALDEANVVRFRERLQELARQTQIIVVTHNRGTIEIADTLYGVSMGADGVSQVLSLRLGEPLAAD